MGRTLCDNFSFEDVGRRSWTSSLAVMQIPEASRQAICGLVIISMLLTHGRSARIQR